MKFRCLFCRIQIFYLKFDDFCVIGNFHNITYFPQSLTIYVVVAFLSLFLRKCYFFFRYDQYWIHVVRCVLFSFSVAVVAAAALPTPNNFPSNVEVDIFFTYNINFEYAMIFRWWMSRFRSQIVSVGERCSSLSVGFKVGVILKIKKKNEKNKYWIYSFILLLFELCLNNVSVLKCISSAVPQIVG